MQFQKGRLRGVTAIPNQIETKAHKKRQGYRFLCKNIRSERKWQPCGPLCDSKFARLFDPLSTTVGILIGIIGTLQNLSHFADR